MAEEFDTSCDFVLDCAFATIRVVGDILVCRNVAGKILRRCQPKETIAIVLTAKQLIQDGKSLITTRLPDSPIEMEFDDNPFEDGWVNIWLPQTEERPLPALSLSSSDIDKICLLINRNIGIKKFVELTNGYRWDDAAKMLKASEEGAGGRNAGN